MPEMDIALVHGNYHGAWCWDLLRPELEQRGHRVFLVDLPITDPAAAAGEYASAIEAVEIAGGHSPFLSRPVELAALIDSLL